MLSAPEHYYTGSLRMKSHLSDDTDEENCDDPIKLFDNDINAVYFGSQPHKRSTRDMESRWTFEPIGNNEFRKAKVNSTFGRPDDDLVQMLQSGATSECEISPLSVKLVDCGKFPWYYRKYTQQIMTKLNLNEHSDSDHDIDVEGVVDDSDDCFIVEDLQDVTTNIITKDQICVKTVKLTERKPKLPKNKLKKFQESMNRRDDKEIQRALSFKNLIKLDLKRNQGLVGMKITQKIETNTTLDVNRPAVKTDKSNVVEEADAKKKCVIADENYLSAADKTLCHIGTQLIPITEEKESNSICQLNTNNKEKDLVGKPTLVIKSSTFQNVPVQFDISKISEKLIDNLKTKKINYQSCEAKLISKLSNKNLLNNPENTLKTVSEKELTIENEKEPKVTITEKLTNSSNILRSHVKDVKKTNKYKNDQIKFKKHSSSHSSLIGLLVTNKSREEIKEIKCTKQKRHRDHTQNKATKLDKKPRKIEKQKREPKSPILHCSTVAKKPKQVQVPPKCNKTDTNSNLPKEPGKLNQIVDKLTTLKSCNFMQDTNRPKHVIPKIAPITKPFDVHLKQASQKENCVIQDKTISQIRNIHAKSFDVSDKLLKNCNEKNCNEVSKADFKINNFHNTQIMSSSQNKNLNEQNVLHEAHQQKVNKHTINAASVTNPTPKAPIKNNKPTVSNSNVSTTAVITPASGANAVLSNQYANFLTPHGPHFPIQNAVPSKISSSNIPNNNNNVPVQNRYASAIILKSNNHTNFPYEKYCEPPVQTMAFQRPMSVLSHTQPRSRDTQPPYPIFYPPAPLGRHQSYFPSSAANSVPNQFNPPQSHIGQQPSNPMQDFYRECWLPQNLAPPPPPPPPVPAPNMAPRNGHVVNQTKDYSNLNRTLTPVIQNPQSVSRLNSINTQQTKNSSIIGINNDGLVKKINIVAMPVKNVNTKGTVKVEQMKIPQIMSPVEHSEVVATKTEMLKELDKLSFVDENINEFKRVYPAINENKTENTLDVAILSKKPCKFETLKLTMKDKPIQTKPTQGYSPPILPIPWDVGLRSPYQKVLDRVTSNLQTQNATQKIALRPGDPRSNLRNEWKPMRKRDFVKCCKRKPNNAWNDDDSKRKDDAKKISLEEYKKRILKDECKSEHYKKICKEKYDISGKRANVEFKYRKNLDYSTETDLGYDSDSTVVL